MRKTVVAIFDSKPMAAYATELLSKNGFDRRNINIIDGKTYQDETGDESADNENWMWCFLQNLFKSSNTVGERWLKAAQRSFMVGLISNSEKEALTAAGILDECGAIDVDEQYHKFFYGREYRDDSDYEREALLNEITSVYLSGGQTYKGEEPIGYYRVDADFELDYKRLKNEDKQNFEFLKSNEGLNGYAKEESRASKMRSLILEKPIAAWRSVEGHFHKRFKLV